MMGRKTEVGARNLSWGATQATPPGAYVGDCGISEWVYPPCDVYSGFVPRSALRLNTDYHRLGCRPSDLVLSPDGQKAGREIWNEMKSIWATRVGVDADALLG